MNVVNVGLWPKTAKVGEPSDLVMEKRNAALKKMAAGDLSVFDVMLSDPSFNVMEYFIEDEPMRRVAIAALLKHHGTGYGSFEGWIRRDENGKVSYEINFEKPLMRYPVE